MRSTTEQLRSVRMKTTAVATATVLVVLVVAALLLVRYFERRQVEQVDARLEASARVVDSFLDGTTPVSVPSAVAGDALVQVVDPAGRVVFAGTQLAGQPPMVDAARTNIVGPTTADVAGVGRVRVVAIPLATNVVLTAESLQTIDRAKEALVRALLVGVPVLVLVLGGLVWLVVGRTLRPVQQAMERERRLVADVSHELRTPLAGARALLESESQVPAEIALNRLEVLAVLDRLDAMTNDLLDAARNEQVGITRGELVDLDDVVTRVVDGMAIRSDVRVDLASVSAGQVRGNEQDLERLVANLVSNAARHADGRVRIALQETGASVVLTVEDDGPGVAPTDRARVFDRFARLDDARTRATGGAGLGLAIARSVADGHGGSIDVTDGQLGGAAFVVSLPAVDGPGTRASPVGSWRDRVPHG